jgi:hypothetical protein
LKYIFSVHCRFFQACIYSAILDNHAKGLRDKVIDVLSDYSKRRSEPALFSPAVSNTFPGTGGLLNTGDVHSCSGTEDATAKAHQWNIS